MMAGFGRAGELSRAAGCAKLETTVPVKGKGIDFDLVRPRAAKHLARVKAIYLDGKFK
jgi:hypothetical protein